MKRYLFIVNPITRGGEKSRKYIDKVHEHSKLDITLYSTEYAGDAKRKASISAIEGYTHVISVGGDGTLNEVVNGVMEIAPGKRPIIGTIPAGGGNDFGRMIGVPREPAIAFDAILRDRIMQVDVCRLNDRYFINNIGAGFDAKASWMAEKVRPLQGMLRYLVGVFLSFLHYEGYPMDVVADGEQFSEKYLLAAIGNSKTTGGGIPITPKAELNDGLLDVCLVGHLPLLKALALLPKVFTGKHVEHPIVRELKCKSIRLNAPSGIPVYVDGELPLPPRWTELDIEVIPQKLEFICGLDQ